jgi:hypothetical protein
MNWLKRSNKKKQITTLIKAMNTEEMEQRVKDLIDKDWTVVSEGTFEANDAVYITSSHRGVRGVSKTSNQILIEGNVTRYWCKMLSPKVDEETVAV